ncbi:hypothetical protein HK104_011171 [Borealophlyctis nickersoniae]|nr:hypothetical protein HK104_011171 [Borealophlyctis nickersoniae]
MHDIIGRVKDRLECCQLPNGVSRDRIVEAGSFAKGTDSWLFSDADLVVFCNDHRKDLGTLLKHYHRFLKQHYENTETTPHSLKLVSETVRFDVLMGLNLSKEPNTPDEPDWERQLRGLTKQPPDFHAAGADDKELAGSYAEVQCAFIRGKFEELGEGCRQLVLLAKVWANTLMRDDKWVGRSTAMELLAIWACETERHEGGDAGLLDGFWRLLQCLDDAQNMRIEWNGWTQHNEIGPSQFKALAEPPYLLDPSNPRNNLFDGKSVPLRHITKYAREALKRLDQDDVSICSVLLPQSYEKIEVASIRPWLMGHEMTQPLVMAKPPHWKLADNKAVPSHIANEIERKRPFDALVAYLAIAFCQIPEYLSNPNILEQKVKEMATEALNQLFRETKKPRPEQQKVFYELYIPCDGFFVKLGVEVVEAVISSDAVRRNPDSTSERDGEERAGIPINGVVDSDKRHSRVTRDVSSNTPPPSPPRNGVDSPPPLAGSSSLLSGRAVLLGKSRF